MASLRCKEGSPIDRLARFTTVPSLLALLLAASFAPLGCMSTAWDRALDADTPQAYHRFIRKYPDSDRVTDAEERIEFHKIKRRPSLKRYAEFRASYPDSELFEELRPLIENLAFDAARAVGTAEAYRSFARDFAGGPFATRAEGNAVYVEAEGFASQPDALRAFAEEHPDSDFSAEAVRSVQSLDTHTATTFRRVGLVIDIAPGTPEVKRLVKAFVDRAKDDYEHSGVRLEPIADIAGPDAPTVRLTIKHAEKIEKPEVVPGTIARAGAVARTIVTLRDDPEADPIFERAFELRQPPSALISGASMLFSSREAKLYWEQFFVPVATWRSSAAVRPVIDLEKKATAVDAVLGRAVVLFSDGDFQLIGLSDPHRPAVLARYDRESKLEKYDGVRILGNRVMIYGPDGLELVEFTHAGLKAVATHSRGQVGQVAAVVPIEEGLLLASSQGLLLAEADGSKAQRLMRRIVLGLDALGETLVFTDGDSVFVSNVPMLRQNRVIAQLRLGRDFKPARVRVVDTTAIVMGQGGIVTIDLSNPAKPRAVSKVAHRESGRVTDAVRVGDRSFLLGARGVLLLDGNEKRVVETVDVTPRERVARTGRHIVVVGEKQLQVVDGLPFARGGAPASH